MVRVPQMKLLQDGHRCCRVWVDRWSIEAEGESLLCLSSVAVREDVELMTEVSDNPHSQCGLLPCKTNIAPCAYRLHIHCRCLYPSILRHPSSHSLYPDSLSLRTRKHIDVGRTTARRVCLRAQPVRYSLSGFRHPSPLLS